ncbi:MAG: Asr1405/Asl0597 family protein [Limnospira sp.]
MFAPFDRPGDNSQGNNGNAQPFLQPQLPQSSEENLKFQPLKVRVQVPADLQWSVFYRLQELSIPCEYSSENGVCVEIADRTIAIQLRCVLHQFIAPLPVLVNWLEHCFELEGN